jgi:MFS family permease
MTATGGGLLMAFLLVYFDRTTGLGLAAIGVAITAGRTIAAMTPLVLGRMLDSLGPRKVALAGDLTTGLGFLVCVWADNALLIALSQILAQAGSHMFWTSSRGLVQIASGGRGVQTWFGLIGSLRNAGLGVGTVLSSLAFSAGSELVLRGVVAACAALYLCSSVALWRWHPAAEGDVGSGAAKKGTDARRGYREVWADGRYLRLLVLNLGLVLAAMVIPLIIAVYTTEQLGLPALVAGGLVVSNTVIVALCSTHVAAWTERRV